MNARMKRLAAGTVVLLSFWVSMLYASSYHFAGGSGEPNDPYQIATAEQLVSIGSDPNLLDKHFVLLNDIDLDPNLPGGRTFAHAVIAPDAYESGAFEGTPFTGSFAGGGHKVRNLIIRSVSADHLALFGCLGKEGVVSDLGVDNARVGESSAPYHSAFAARNHGRMVRCYAEARVCGFDGVGVLAAFNDGEIVDCWTAGEAVGSTGIGGLAGYNWPGVIWRSHAAARVRTGELAETWFGGLVGQNGGMIVGCYATGAVSGQEGSCLGGLVGENMWGGTIVSCYATGDVSVEARSDHLGGLVGNLMDSSIYDCYATGSVSAGDGVSSMGGLVGHSQGGITDSYCTGRVSAGKNSKSVGGLAGSALASNRKIKGCFWDVETSGLSESSGGTGLTTAQMQNIATFLNAGWDVVDEQTNGTTDLWSMPQEGGYPLLTVPSVSFQPYELEGIGAPDDPYRIATARDLGAINHYDPAACYRLEADVNLAGIPWHTALIPYFDGRLDGAEKVVTGLMVQGDAHLGLFGTLGRHALVVNLGVRDANVTGENFLGLLAGENSGCITACYVSGSIVGNREVGTMTGWNAGCITDSYAIGELTNPQAYRAGGLAGLSFGAVNRSYAAVHVVSPPQGLWPGILAVGGLMGMNDVIGRLGQIHASYFLIDTDGGGPDNGCGTALTDAQMKQQASFPGWDFDATWTICADQSYPRLRWENVQCEE